MTKAEELLQRSLVILRECGREYYETTFGKFECFPIFWGKGTTNHYKHALFGNIDEIIHPTRPCPESPEGLPRNPIWIELQSALSEGENKDRDILLIKLERKIARVLKEKKK